MNYKVGSAIAVCVVLFASGSAAPAKTAKQPRVDPGTLMRREETMVLNLNIGRNSTKFYLLESLRMTRAMQKDLYKAMRQVETVDQNYAKARNHPDDRTMNSTVERLKQAQKTAEQLEKELEETSVELKSDIQSTLISK